MKYFHRFLDSNTGSHSCKDHSVCLRYLDLFEKPNVSQQTHLLALCGYFFASTPMAQNCFFRISLGLLSLLSYFVHTLWFVCAMCLYLFKFSAVCITLKVSFCVGQEVQCSSAVVVFIFPFFSALNSADRLLGSVVCLAIMDCRCSSFITWHLVFFSIYLAEIETRIAAMRQGSLAGCCVMHGHCCLAAVCSLGQAHPSCTALPVALSSSSGSNVPFGCTVWVGLCLAPTLCCWHHPGPF